MPAAVTLATLVDPKASGAVCATSADRQQAKVRRQAEALLQSRSLCCDDYSNCDSQQLMDGLWIARLEAMSSADCPMPLNPKSACSTLISPI